MKWRRIAAYLGVLCPMALRAVLLPAFQTTTIQPGKRIYVVAVRDSRLFTMNIPDSDQIKVKTRSVRWAYDILRPGNNQIYILPITNCQWNVKFPGRPPMVLPVPANSLQDCEEQNPLRPTLEGPALDRTRPDAEIRRRVEREFQKQKLYLLADSPDQADYVFLVEARYDLSFLEFAASISAPSPIGLPRTLRSNHLESAWAIVVPSAVYRQHPSDNAALLAARLWDGETIGEDGPNYRGLSPDCNAEVGPCGFGKPDTIDQGTVIDPSPEDLVKKFHNKFKGPRFHVPLCLPANPPFSRNASTRSDKSKPVLNTNEAGMPVSGLNETKVSDDDKTIKVDVTLVTVPAMVIGSNGEYVRDLKTSDFRLFENGVQQKIDRLIPAAEPVNMVLVLGNMPLNSEFSFKDVQRSALEFVDAMRAEDRIMVVSFDDKIHIESEFTNDRERLRRAILQIEFQIS